MTTPTPVDEGTPLDLEAIKARADAATEGPWHSTYMGDLLAYVVGSTIERDDYSRDLVGRIYRDPDAAFIAAARSDVPALVAEVSRLRSELATAQEDAERMRLVLAIQGGGVDPNGYYAGTPGWRLRELLAAEADRDAALKVVEAAQALREALRAANEDDDWDEEPYPTVLSGVVAAVDAWKADHP